MTREDVPAVCDPRGRSARASGRPSVVATLARAGRGIRWYVTTLMGDRAYEVYATHQRAHHPDLPVLTERQFWRARSDEQSRNPGARCC